MPIKMAQTMSLVASFFVIVIAYYGFQQAKYAQRRKGLRVPPGPKGWPVIGNLFELLEGDGESFPVFRKWEKRYGPVMQFEVLGTKNVLLSTRKATQDLLAKRSAKYSDRGAPHGPIFVDDHNILLLDKNEVWTRESRVIHQAVLTSLGSGGKYLDMMDEEATATLCKLLTNPKDFVAHFQALSYSVLTRPFLGFSVKSTKDPYMVEAEESLIEGIRCFRPEEYPSNLIPILRLFWFLPSVRKLHELKESNRRRSLELQERVKKESRDRGAESIYRQFIEHRKEFHDISDVELAACFTGILSGGTRTLYVGCMTMPFLMLLYPDWQRKAQEHIDEVVGPDRVPAIGDISQLHVIRAIIKEGIRYHALRADVSVPHKLSEDDEYEGYFFEKGTVFHANTTGFMMDKDEYPDQQEFNPARWLEPSYPTYKEPLTQYPNCKNFPPFGFGRRVCAGLDLAEKTLVIVLAKLIWAFDFQTPLGPDGKPVKVEMEYDFAPSKQPKEFPCNIVPRRDPKSKVMQELFAGL